MNLKNDQELENTKRKLVYLEQGYEEARNDRGENEELREITMESLKRLINQLKEEIARYEAHQPAR